MVLPAVAHVLFFLLRYLLFTGVLDCSFGYSSFSSFFLKERLNVFYPGWENSKTNAETTFVFAGYYKLLRIAQS